jgi:hypothetical protein
VAAALHAVEAGGGEQGQRREKPGPARDVQVEDTNRDAAHEESEPAPTGKGIAFLGRAPVPPLAGSRERVRPGPGEPGDQRSREASCTIHSTSSANDIPS